jgi:hypothetical protein
MVSGSAAGLHAGQDSVVVIGMPATATAALRRWMDGSSV